ncbi:MAG: hypothetical protein ACE5ER_09680, partial [Nitrospinaceae bacterium]
MPRRRLHGETQKRRKKRSTRLLKRKDSIVRVNATLRPAPFERSPNPEREDLEFLEAMREMDVRRSPWSGESSARRRKVETVQFLAGEEEENHFRQSMEGWGVRPLEGRRAKPAGLGDPPAPPASGDSDPDEAGPVLREETREEAEKGTRKRESTETRTRTHSSASAGQSAQPESGRTVFRTEGGREEMEAWFRENEFQPEWKFAGVEAQKKPPPHSRGISPEAEPDDVLDLHGKTLEEA